jgi:hypothetical protein
LQRARAITGCLKGNTPTRTSQSSSDDYELICFPAKSSSHHLLIESERERANGNEPEHQ